MRKIAFLSEKGGVGKSTLCLNIGALLGSELGKRVLIVDLDGNACVSYTLVENVTYQNSMVAVLAGAAAWDEIVRETFIEGVCIAPGSIALRSLNTVGFEPTNDGRVSSDGSLSEMALAVAFAELSSDAYDYIFVDCPGGHAFMENAALLACDEVIVPTGPAVYDLLSFAPTLQMIDRAREARGNDVPRFIGFLPNRAQARGLSKGIRALLDEFQAPIFTEVRASERLNTSPGQEKADRRVVALTYRDTTVAKSMRQVALEIEHGIEVARGMMQEFNVGPSVPEDE